jgi:hypothetical protein
MYTTQQQEPTLWTQPHTLENIEILSRMLNTKMCVRIRLSISNEKLKVEAILIIFNNLNFLVLIDKVKVISNQVSFIKLFWSDPFVTAFS